MSRLIDADELLTAFPIDDEPTVTKSCVRMTIQYMPTIEPMRKRGRWITKSTNGEMFDCCSVCGYVEWDNPKNFCPNCGADMRKGEKE